MMLPILISVSLASGSYLFCAKLAEEVVAASTRAAAKVPHRQSKARIWFSLDLFDCVSYGIGSVCWRSNLVGGALSTSLCREAFTDASTFLRLAVPVTRLRHIQHPLAETSNKKPPAHGRRRGRNLV